MYFCMLCYPLNQVQFSLEQNDVVKICSCVWRKQQHFQPDSSIHFPCFKWRKTYILL